MKKSVVLWALLMAFMAGGARAADELSPLIEAGLKRAGKNRAELQKALDTVPTAERAGMRFLIAHMPDRDLKSLSARFLLENCRHAYQVWQKTPWRKSVPQSVFLNNVLPYASINERRDSWRKDFYARFHPLMKDAKTPAEAAALLNQKIFPLLKVRYSTKRPKADQSPYESIKAGTASCTGLSVLLIDACRSVGVPARFVGTPLWTNKSGNHSWIEVWDGDWHFTGAAEPTGNQLDRAWFVGRAAKAQRDHRLHAIYAASFRRTPQHFPFVWDRGIKYVHAVNVTDRYTRLAEVLPAGTVRVMFRAVEADGGRVRAELAVQDAARRKIFSGRTNDEGFDANNHISVPLRVGKSYRVSAKLDGRVVERQVKVAKADQLITFRLPARKRKEPKPDTVDQVKSSAGSSKTIAALRKYLAKVEGRPPLGKQAFASSPLTKDEADAVTRLLVRDHHDMIRRTRSAEMKARKIKLGSLTMPFYYKLFGKKPATGRSLYISMHGGGGTTKRVNDGQWENQKRLYSLPEGVYLVPRAPTNTWNLWHQGHIDAFFDRLIENLVVFEDVDPDRVFIMGYSAGGDGVFQLAPRMADRLAAAAMMAGHPNETSPLGLRNLPFTIHMGGKDGSYNRNGKARSWKKQLEALRKGDPGGYQHLVKIYPDKGHWMDRKDASAIPWMAKFRRNPIPRKIVWKQDDVRSDRFYWLAAGSADQSGRAHVVANYEKQQIEVSSASSKRVTIRLNDAMLNLDQPVVVKSGEKTLIPKRKLARTIKVIAKTLAERGDPKAVFSAELTVNLK